MTGSDEADASLFGGNEALFGREVSGPWPILMRRDDIILMKRAEDHSGKSDKTIRGWCKLYGIGRQSCPGAPIEISAPALEMMMQGDIVALELLREGKRTHPRVSRYFSHLGIPV